MKDNKLTGPKSLKDYLHLYMGCKVESAFIGDNQIMVGIYPIELGKENSALIRFAVNGEVQLRPCSINAVKPILRPLSSMTEEEATAIIQIIYNEIFDIPDIVLVDIETLSTDEGAGFIAVTREFGERIGLTIKPDKGIDFSIKSQKMNVRQFDLIPYLLSHHFDLFNLVESGIAIAKQ